MCDASPVPEWLDGFHHRTDISWRQVLFEEAAEFIEIERGVAELRALMRSQRPRRHERVQ